MGQPATRVPGRRGPPSQLAQQLDQLAQLPKARQKVVYDVLDMVLTKAQVEAGQAGRQEGDGNRDSNRFHLVAQKRRQQH